MSFVVYANHPTNKAIVNDTSCGIYIPHVNGIKPITAIGRNLSQILKVLGIMQILKARRPSIPTHFVVMRKTD